MIDEVVRSIDMVWSTKYALLESWGGIVMDERGGGGNDTLLIGSVGMT